MLLPLKAKFWPSFTLLSASHLENMPFRSFAQVVLSPEISSVWSDLQSRNMKSKYSELEPPVIIDKSSEVRLSHPSNIMTNSFAYRQVKPFGNWMLFNALHR